MIINRSFADHAELGRKLSLVLVYDWRLTVGRSEERGYVR